jgi:FAD/FMN-containing dehydrogenase/Fe-S oxidoreductase
VDDLQKRILEDLTGSFRGELRFDVVTRSIYSVDASLYQQRPLGVAYPVDVDDVTLLATYAGEHNLPLIARGAGTQVTGAALGSGIIVDFSRHMRRILEVAHDTVRVEPGIVRDHLNRHLREQGRYFPPDPSNSAVTTIGGMLAVDAAGSHAVRVGSTRDHVRSLQVILAGGATLELGMEPADADQLAALSAGPGTTDADRANLAKREILSRLKKTLADNHELIRERQPALIRNCCGYYLRDVLTSAGLNLPRLLVGSEGTLGLFTAATLHTAPLPAHRGAVLLLFGNLDAAIAAVQAVAEQQPSACDLLDRRLLSLGREADERFEAWIPKEAEAGLLVEQTGYSQQQVCDRIEMAVQTVRRKDGSVVVAREAYSTEDVEFLWSLPSRVVPLLSRLPGNVRPLPFIEDVAVPPATLSDFLHRAQRVFQKHELTTSLYAHAASGQVHMRPFLSPLASSDTGRIEEIARDLYEVVFSVGGSISGEHGDGLSRTAFIRSQYGPLYKVFREIKDVFDPHNLLNPGKIISDDPHTTIRRLRTVADNPVQPLELQLRWSEEAFAGAAERCTACGVCRAVEPDALRMCPLFHIDPVEEASPRAKAVAMRDVASGALDAQVLASEPLKYLADLCFNCKQCQSECPSNVNIPQLMIEAKSSYVAANGLSPADWSLSRAHSFSRLGCRTAPFSNWILNSPAARWMIEKILGISRQRRLPAFANRPFMSRSKRRRWEAAISAARESSDGPSASHSIIYFVDHFANYHDTDLAAAFLAVMKHNGIEVLIPPRQTATGMAMISAGDLEAARDMAEQNVRELCELVREGHTIVCTEPAAAVCLRDEYPMLLDHPDVGLVAANVVEAGAFLARLHEQGRLRTDFASLELTAAYHTPCHLRALGEGAAFADLLELIPGFKLRRIEKGCSGMAGAFGLTREHFKTSLQIGAGLMAEMQAPDLHIGVTECSSCKLQMEQAAEIPTVHPLKLLAIAYGLMPQLKRSFKPGKKRLLIT